MRRIAWFLALAALLAGCVQPPPRPLPPAAPAPLPAPLPGPEVVVGTPGRPGRAAGDRRIGEAAHPEVVRQNGGIYDDPALQVWLEDIVARLEAEGRVPGGPFRITLLDTPAANAFAVPGGYLYVTRGLLALANDEDELASVIAHEMGHLAARHPETRQRRAAEAQGAALLGLLLGAAAGVDGESLRGLAEAGQVAGAAYVADYSREQEFEADALGVAIMSEAGYDTFAAPDFLDSLLEQSALQARIAGRQYDPNRVDFLSSHPATGERVRAAAAEAARVAGRGGPRLAEDYLWRLDGMIYGDSPAQGYVRGGGFAHPELRFAFEAPAGFRITNSSRAVTAEDGRGGVFVLEGAPPDAGRLDEFIARRWAPQVARQAGGGRLEGLALVRINGLEAARAVMPVRTRDGAADMLMVAIRHEGAVYRLTGLAPQGSGLLPVLEAAAGTFRPLSPAEAARLAPRRIEIVRVRPGDTAARLAAGMAVEGFAEERFRVLNGLAPGEEPRPGTLVKLVR